MVDGKLPRYHERVINWFKRGRVVRVPDLKSGGRGFKSCSDHYVGVVSW